MKAKIFKNKTALIFIAPSISGFAVFFLIPFLIAVYYSLVDNPISGNFVGLSNYTDLLSNQVFLKAISNSIIFTVISVPLNILLSLGIALILNKNIYCRNFIRMSFIAPLVIPIASVVLIWQVIFDFKGSLNGLVIFLGFSSVDWMKSEFSRFVVLIVYLWKNAGYNMILLLAGLQNIPGEYYEAADIEGAGSWTQFFRITLVYLTPVLFFVFVISIINSFKVFRETYLISGSYPYDSIYMLQHYMNNMFISLDYQKLTSAAVIMAIFISLLVVIMFIVERKISRIIG